MLPDRSVRIAALGAGALVLTALTLPSTAAAAPHTAVGAVAAATAAKPYSAFSSGDILYANAINTGVTDTAKASTGQSAAGVAEHGAALTLSDQLLQPLLAASTSGKTAFGHGSALNVGLVGTTSSKPQVASTLVEATSPAPSAATGGNTIPASPVLTATVLPGTAAANTNAAGSCVTGKDLSNGAEHVVDATAIDAGAAATVGQLDGTSDTVSHTKLVKIAKTGKYGVLGETTLTLAPLTVLKGTPLEVKIELLKDIRLTTQAGGVAGTSVVSYGAVGAVNTTPVLKLTIGGSTQTLTSQQVFGGKGIQLALGAADVFIGGPAHSLTGLEGSKTAAAANGTTASAAADFVRVSVPGKLVPSTNPFDGSLAPLNGLVNPVLSSISSATTSVQSALEDAGLSVADVRQGHLEASSAVPVGGIDCSVDNPLDESVKDVSVVHVQPGSTFQYDIRVPNRGTSDVTNTKVVDTYDKRLEFVSSVPAPIAHTGNVLTYDLGTIAPNAFKTIQFTFKVPSGASQGTKYRNDAIITGTYQGQPITKTVGIPGPTVGPTRSGTCNLSGSTKFASNYRVKTGESFGYFINVLNSGGQPCLDTTVKDTLVSGVSFVSCSDSCTHTGQDLAWSLGTIAPGEGRVLYVIVKVTATSGRLPNTAIVSSPSGGEGRPNTPGPLVGLTTVAAPGNPADGPDGALPRTGLPIAVSVLGLLLLGSGAFLYRRRLTH